MAKGLDYTKGCVNFRDVGGCLSLITEDDLLPPQRILRGGKLDFVDDASKIGHPGTIINLRKGADPETKHFGADYWHFAISNKYEKYNTTDPLVRRWLNEVLGCLSSRVNRLPVLIHCTSGKDRTGVTVAALLTALGFDRESIVQEYLWSEGRVERAWIEQALDGIGDPGLYFQRLDLSALKKKLLRAGP